MKWSRLAALGVLGLMVPLVLGQMAALPPPIYFLHDQQYYLAMAESQDPPRADTHAPPFCWRVLPSALVQASGLPADVGFHVLTLMTLTLIPPLTAAFVSAAGASVTSALVTGAVIAVAPPVAGYLSWDHIRPDSLSLLLIVLSAWSVVTGRGAVLIGAMAALTLTKETWLVSAIFALVWTRFYQPALWKWAVAGSAVAVGIAVILRLAIQESGPYSLIQNVRDLYWPLEARTVARRLLLATAATWNVLAPLAAFALARRLREPRAWAVAIAVLVASAQILVAIDTQRLVAAAYPFVLLASAWELDRLPARRRARAGALIVLAQVPWLVTYARVWTLPLRGVEIALAGLTLAAIIYGATRERARPAEVEH